MFFYDAIFRSCKKNLNTALKYFKYSIYSKIFRYNNKSFFSFIKIKYFIYKSCIENLKDFFSNLHSYQRYKNLWYDTNYTWPKEKMQVRI